MIQARSSVLKLWRQLDMVAARDPVVTDAH